MGDVVSPSVEVGEIKVFDVITRDEAKEQVSNILEQAEMIGDDETTKDISAIRNMLDTVPDSTLQYYVRLAQIKLDYLRKGK